jgi:hypothetical protein
MFLAAVVQMTSTSEPEVNWFQARRLVERAASYGAQLIATPENTNYLVPPAEKVRTAEPLGGERVYVKTDGPLTMRSWLDGLRGGRSFLTNGPMPTLEVDGKGPGETCELAAAGKVRVIAT